uniref:Uncharacterized protein n=1 Tax=Candidatus Kentrum sp. LPFa TaxID=2126335 RepID=A0A450X5P3_9GAMM|nr:MAG: hypothetical protein BECKLPF1236A_GA0070988_104281 [Candidatus Kentron sp. LPFa]VFK35834.1 MAG: hypothetical protein BECKLPF1236C_GA0070990_104312 [Candidatus Kentron sp. LPFa]
MGATGQPTKRVGRVLTTTGWSHGDERLERACAQAVRIGSPTYRSIASILKNGLEKDLPHESISEHEPLVHDNLRGPGYYR